jgi:hypothetical protein
MNAIHKKIDQNNAQILLFYRCLIKLTEHPFFPIQFPLKYPMAESSVRESLVYNLNQQFGYFWNGLGLAGRLWAKLG